MRSVAPDFDEVTKLLRAHHSFRFASDPKGAILDAAKEVD